MKRVHLSGKGQFSLGVNSFPDTAIFMKEKSGCLQQKDMCLFDQLYFSGDGYVVRCKVCGLFQLGFGSTMLSLTEEDYAVFTQQVTRKTREESCCTGDDTKCVVLATAYRGVHLLLTVKELNNLNRILEEADTEAKALAMIQLFH
jgi:hypothetical protein